MIAPLHEDELRRLMPLLVVSGLLGAVLILLLVLGVTGVSPLIFAIL